MKRFLSLLVVLTMALSFAPVIASAYDKYGDYLYYTENIDGTVRITDCESTAVNITIPSTINGMNVTEISDWAFSCCSDLKSVIIPDGVTNIGGWAFEYCSSLANITIPDSVTTIENYAFYNCTSLASVIIPESVTSVEGYAFCDCTSLTSISIPDNVITIGGDVIYNTAYYNNLDNWENNVLYIGNYLIATSSSLIGDYKIKPGTKAIAGFAFSASKSLTSVTIPDSVTLICDNAFWNCTSLTSISIPDRVITIGGGAFYNTGYYNNSSNWENNVLYIGNHLIATPPNLSGKCEIKSGIKTIANAAFADCKSLTDVIVPDSVIAIGVHAFSMCSELTSVSIGNGVRFIGDRAFLRCANLKNVSLGDGIAYIGESAFYRCALIKDVYYSGTKKQWESIEIEGGNDCLTEANIHYKKTPRIDDEPTIEQGYLNIRLSDVEYDSSLITVFSSGGVFVSVDNTTISSRDTEKSVTIPEGASMAKVFIWDSLTGMCPLCDAVAVELQ